jgi:hypothetical protein
MQKIQTARARFTWNQATPELVAATIFDAANDRSDRLRYLVGADAKRLWLLRRWLGPRMQMRLVRNLLKI